MLFLANIDQLGRRILNHVLCRTNTAGKRQGTFEQTALLPLACLPQALMLPGLDPPARVGLTHCAHMPCEENTLSPKYTS